MIVEDQKANISFNEILSEENIQNMIYNEKDKNMSHYGEYIDNKMVGGNLGSFLSVLGYDIIANLLSNTISKLKIGKGKDIIKPMITTKPPMKGLNIPILSDKLNLTYVPRENIMKVIKKKPKKLAFV